MTHAKTVAMVWGSEPPAYSIGYASPMWPTDSGFSVLFGDAPDPDEVEGPEDPRISLLCLHCLLDHHPELGRGLDLAREYGVAALDENDEWVVGDLSRTREAPRASPVTTSSASACSKQGRSSGVPRPVRHRRSPMPG